MSIFDWNEEISFDMDMPKEQIRQFEMAVLGQGMYNAMVLRRDGYLSQENCWKPQEGGVECRNG